MQDELNQKKRFGTGPVYITAISTILGAILFLRFGYAVGTLGLIGVVLIILLGGSTKRGQQKAIDQAIALHDEYKARKKIPCNTNCINFCIN